MDLLEFVGDIAVATTILQFLSGILVCKQYVVNKTTGDASALPFLCGLFSGVLWFLYGCAKVDSKIMLVNIVGFTLMTLYTFTFIHYSLHKIAVMKQLAFVLVQTFLIVWYATHETDPDRLVENLATTDCTCRSFSVDVDAQVECNGRLKYDAEVRPCAGEPPACIHRLTRLSFYWSMAASIVTLLTVAAPMSKLMHVLKVKNTSCLPFPLILMSFLVCSLWTCYGALQHDFYLWCVNFIGVGLSVSQLSLFIWFPRTPTSTSSSPILPKYTVH